MSLRLFAILAALIAGVAALFALKLIGLVIKFALGLALLVALAAFVAFEAIARKFRQPR